MKRNSRIRIRMFNRDEAVYLNFYGFVSGMMFI